MAYSYDGHANFAVSTVATAPSPATSGTSLIVHAGDGALFPAVPFNATVWPSASSPVSSNVEVVRVTAISTDTFTIVRAQEGTAARSVSTSFSIAACVSAKSLTDIESDVVAGPRGIMAAPVSTTSNGTATSSTTDTLDASLGNYQFTAVSGRRYRAILTGCVGNGSVLNDVFAVTIKDSGSASTPTSASTVVADTEWRCEVATASNGRFPIIFAGDTFVASSSGTHTLAFFAQRVTGSGVLTPVSTVNSAGASAARSLYVEDIGAF